MQCFGVETYTMKPTNESLRLFLWGFHYDDDIKAVKNLERRGVLKAIHWYGNHPALESLNDIVHNPETVLQENMDPIPPKYDEKIRRYFISFAEGYSRVSYSRGTSIQDLWHLFYLYCAYFFSKLKQGEIDAVMFQNLPHHGIDITLYAMAKAMDVPTHLSTQSLYPNRFWYCTSIDDFGRFSHPYEDKTFRDITIEKRFAKPLFYMKNFRRKKLHCLASLLNDTIRVQTRKRKKPMLFSGVWQKYRECRDYKKYAYVLPKKPDLAAKFVYFPLQLQPELTTSILGGKYVDQLLAIEQLSQLIPAGWRIYAKENPKQSARQRGELFYRRLKKIKNLDYISPDFDTYTLIERSQFVSVVTGTAGWEAISGGKNVLIFGKAWYRKLPGVFEYSPSFDLKTLIDYKIDHTLLEKAYTKLLRKSFPGIVDPTYVANYPQYSSKENIRHIENYIRTVLGLRERSLPSDSRS